MNRKEFLGAITPLAIMVGKQYGIDPRVIIAQGALESGWGASAPGNNYFGVKSHGKSGGQTVATHEMIDGKMVGISDNFRKYDGMLGSMVDYADFLKNNPRYADVFNQGDYQGQINAIANAGYATDDKYASKLTSIANNLDLGANGGNEALAAIGNAAPGAAGGTPNAFGYANGGQLSGSIIPAPRPSPTSSAGIMAALNQTNPPGSPFASTQNSGALAGMGSDLGLASNPVNINAVPMPRPRPNLGSQLQKLPNQAADLSLAASPVNVSGFGSGATIDPSAGLSMAPDVGAFQMPSNFTGGANVPPMPRPRPNIPTTSLDNNFPGMVSPGNIDLDKRKVFNGPSGDYRTENSISIGTDQGEVLIPTVINGHQLSEQGAIAHYNSTGENLGVFKTPDAADAYAQKLHERQAQVYAPQNSSIIPPPPRPRPIGAPNGIPQPAGLLQQQVARENAGQSPGQLGQAPQPAMPSAGLGMQRQGYPGAPQLGVGSSVADMYKGILPQQPQGDNPSGYPMGGGSQPGLIPNMGANGQVASISPGSSVGDMYKGILPLAGQQQMTPQPQSNFMGQVLSGQVPPITPQQPPAVAQAPVYSPTTFDAGDPMRGAVSGQTMPRPRPDNASQGIIPQVFKSAGRLYVANPNGGYTQVGKDPQGGLTQPFNNSSSIAHTLSGGGIRDGIASIFNGGRKDPSPGGGSKPSSGSGNGSTKRKYNPNTNRWE